MKSKNKMKYFIGTSTIFLIGAILLYAIVCYPAYIWNKSNVINKLYEELKDMEISDMDEEDRESLNEYQDEKIDILIVDEQYRLIYSSKGDVTESYIRRHIKERKQEFKDTADIDTKIYESRQVLVLRGRILQHEKYYYVYMRKDVQSAVEIVHVSICYFGIISLILILGQFWWLYRKNMDEKIGDNQKNFCLQEKQREFVANISHELKTPLAVVSSQVEMLELMGDQIDKDYYFASVHEELDKMSKMIGELLEFSMLDSALDNMEIMDVDMSEMTEYLLLRYDALFQRQGIRIEKNIAANAVVKGNQRYLERAVNNYLMNAMQHTGNGKKISISLQKTRQYVYISVFNEGERISEERLEHIWDSFYTYSKKRKKEDLQSSNAGIGLYTVKKIVDRHNGKCGIENMENGVKFWIEIPININKKSKGERL